MTDSNKNAAAITYGFTSDNDESVQGANFGSGGKFGLNEGYLVKFELVHNAGKNKTPGEALDYWFRIGDQEFKNRLFPVSRVFDKDGNDLQPGTPEYIEKANQSIREQGAVMTHILKGLGIPEQTISTVVNTPSASFGEWVSKYVSLLPQGFDQKPFHIFLEYQWISPEDLKKKDQEKTYLTVPKNMKGGYFAVQAVGNIDDWSELREWTEKNEDGVEIAKEGLTYINKAGQMHVFKRNTSFLEGYKGTQQFKSDQAQVAPQAQQFVPPAAGGNAAKHWGA